MKKMDSILFWKIILWICPIIISSIMLIASYKIFALEKIKSDNEKAKTNEFQNTSLKNQDTLKNNDTLLLLNTNTIITKVDNSNDLFKINENEVKIRFEIENRPEVLMILDTVLHSGYNRNYNITVKNFGKSTANQVMLEINYITPHSIIFGKRIAELPSNEKVTFQIPFPNEEIFKFNGDNWKDDLLVFMEKYNNGIEDVRLRFKITYNWNGKQYSSKDYILIHHSPDKITVW